MKRIFAGKSMVGLALVWSLLATLLAAGPACQAQSSPNLDKHARKVYKKLTKYRSGTCLNVALRDGTESTGELGALTPTAFTITNADNNTPETHQYSEVAGVQRGREYIGAGSGPGHHIRLWVPVVVGVVAAGAAVTALEVR